MVFTKARWHGKASSHKALTHTMDIAALLPHSERFLWVTEAKLENLHRYVWFVEKYWGGLFSRVCLCSNCGDEEQEYLTCYFSVREGALTFFFWFTLQIPESQQKEATAERVNTVLHQELSASFNSSGSLSYQREYRVNPDSLVLLGKYQLLSSGLSSQKGSTIQKVRRKGQESIEGDRGNLKRMREIVRIGRYNYARFLLIDNNWSSIKKKNRQKNLWLWLL